MKHLGRILASGCLIVAATALAACGGKSASGSTPPGGPPSGSITVYSGQHEQTTAKLVAAFEKQTHIKVALRSDSEDALGNQIIQEGSRSPADVFYAENTPVLEALRENGLLSRLPNSILARVSGKYNSPQAGWVGVSARASALVYNTKQVAAATLPASILELAQPQWKGKIAYAPTESDFQPLVTAIAKVKGAAAAESWLSAIKANGKIYPDNEAVASQVNNGQSAVGLINTYYWYRLRQEVGVPALHSALHYYAAGDPGSLLNVSGAATLKSSANKPAADAFVAFLVSRSGQQIIANSDSYEYPLGSGVQTTKLLRPFSQLSPPPVSLSDLGDGGAPLKLEQKLGLL